MLKQIEHKENFFDAYVWNNFIPKDHRYVKIKELIKVDFIPDLVKDTYKNENPQGNNPVDPRTLFLICIAEYLENLSDVKIVEKIAETPVLKWFVGLSPADKVPDDSTVCKFRTQRMGEEKFKEAFYNIVDQIKDMGLIDGQVQSQDATHVWADISLFSPFHLLNKCRINLLNSALNSEGHKTYDKLNEKYDFKLLRNPPNRQKHFEDLIKVCGELLAEVKRSKTLLNYKKVAGEVRIMERVLEERKDEYYDDENKKQKKEDEEKIKGKMINPADPDACWGAKSDTKFFAGYKVEVNLDHLYDFITAIDVMTANYPEEYTAAPLLKEQFKYLGFIPRHFLADAKYSFGTTRVELKAIGIPCLYIPEIKPRNKYGKEFNVYSFEWDWGSMNLLCPAGYPAEAMCKDDDKLGFDFKFNAGVCKRCDFRNDCTASKENGRRALLPHTYWDHKEGFRIMTTEEYQIMYKEQRYKIERKNADMKKWHGLENARYRGIDKMRIQAYLTAIAVNLKKWVKFAMGKLANGITDTLAKLAALSPPRGALRPERV